MRNSGASLLSFASENAVIVTSTGGGDTWSCPTLINEDTPGLRFYQGLFL